MNSYHLNSQEVQETKINNQIQIEKSSSPQQLIRSHKQNNSNHPYDIENKPSSEILLVKNNKTHDITARSRQAIQYSRVYNIDDEEFKRLMLDLKKETNFEQKQTQGNQKAKSFADSTQKQQELLLQRQFEKKFPSIKFEPTRVNLHLGSNFEQTIRQIQSSGKPKPNSQALIKALQLIGSKTNPNCSLVRCVDLLYKKFILKRKEIFQLEKEVQKKRFKLAKQRIRSAVYDILINQEVNYLIENFDEDTQVENQRINVSHHQTRPILLNRKLFKEDGQFERKISQSKMPFHHSSTETPKRIAQEDIIKKSQQVLSFGQGDFKQPQLKTQLDDRSGIQAGGNVDPHRNLPVPQLRQRHFINRGSVPGFRRTQPNTSYEPRPQKLLPPQSSLYNAQLSSLLIKKKHTMSKKEHYTEKYRTQQKIAKTFCSVGYGMEVAREFLGADVQRNLYNNTITTIIRESFRKLQEYLVKECGMAELRILDRQLFSSIKTELVHCRKFLEDQKLKCFLAFIAMNYRIPDFKPPTQEEALSLHDFIRQKALTKIRHRLKTKYTRDGNQGLRKVRNS